LNWPGRVSEEGEKMAQEIRTVESSRETGASLKRDRRDLLRRGKRSFPREIAPLTRADDPPKRSRIQKSARARASSSRESERPPQNGSPKRGGGRELHQELARACRNCDACRFCLLSLSFSQLFLAPSFRIRMLDYLGARSVISLAARIRQSRCANASWIKERARARENALSCVRGNASGISQSRSFSTRGFFEGLNLEHKMKTPRRQWEPFDLFPR